MWCLPTPLRDRLKTWQEALIQKLESHTQEEVFQPHITLGYIPRSLTTEQAIEFARNLIKLPLRLGFERIMLEEFSENQNSLTVDSLPLG